MAKPSNPSPSNSRILRGAAAESAVAKFLVERGYEILGRNVRVGHLEVDLLVKKADVVAVVEVRCRSQASWVGPFESMTKKKVCHVVAAGRALWNLRFESDPSVNRLRFDAASVVVTAQNGFVIEYVEGFWEAD